MGGAPPCPRGRRLRPALLANDGAVLMLTPIFATLLLRIYPDRRHRLPFIFAAGFFADAMSGLFIPSNLTNIILADATHLSFARAAVWMALPTIAAFLVGAGAFGWRFRRDIRKLYDPSAVADPAGAIRDPLVFRAGWVILGMMVIGYIIGSEPRLPVSLVAGGAAILLLALVQVRGLRSAGEALRAAPWNILIYALGMFVVITAAYKAHLLGFLTAPLRAGVAPAAGAGRGVARGGHSGLADGGRQQPARHAHRRAGAAHGARYVVARHLCDHARCGYRREAHAVRLAGDAALAGHTAPPRHRDLVGPLSA